VSLIAWGVGGVLASGTNTRRIFDRLRMIDPICWSNQEAMSDNKSTPKVSVRTGVKAGGAKFNHGLRVRTKIKAAGPVIQHGLRVRTKVKAAGPVLQHGVRIR
jgi:hypothetical protein